MVAVANEDIDTRLYEIGGCTTYPASDGGNTTTTLEFGLQLWVSGKIKSLGMSWTFTTHSCVTMYNY